MTRGMRKEEDMEAQSGDRTCEMSTEDLFRRLGIGTEEERLAIQKQFEAPSPVEERSSKAVEVVVSDHS